MHRAGRVNFMLLGVLAVVIAVAFFLFGGRNTPTDAAVKYMTALSKGNVEQLMDLTYIQNGDRATMRKQYEFATQVAAPYYSFLWRVRGEKDATDKNASVQLSLIRNAARPGGFEENYELPMVKSDGKWLVDVAAINSTMYPDLPRG